MWDNCFWIYSYSPFFASSLFIVCACFAFIILFATWQFMSWYVDGSFPSGMFILNNFDTKYVNNRVHFGSKMKKLRSMCLEVWKLYMLGIFSRLLISVITFCKLLQRKCYNTHTHRKYIMKSCCHSVQNVYVLMLYFTTQDSHVNCIILMHLLHPLYDIHLLFRQCIYIYFIQAIKRIIVWRSERCPSSF